jgi:hypothetical protein
MVFATEPGLLPLQTIRELPQGVRLLTIPLRQRLLLVQGLMKLHWMLALYLRASIGRHIPELYDAVQANPALLTVPQEHISHGGPGVAVGQEVLGNRQ